MNLPARLISASALLSLTILAGRATGFAREIQISAALGLSRSTDLAVILLTTPDLLVNLLLSGGLSAALIPEFRALDAVGRKRLLIGSLAIIGALTGAVGLAVAVFPSILLAAFAPAYLGSAPPGFFLGSMLVAAAIPISAMSGVTTALLNSQDRFFVAGAGTLIFNITIIAIFALGGGSDPLVVLGVAILCGCALRIVSQLFAVLPHVGSQGSVASPIAVKRLMAHFLAAMSASSIVLLVPAMLRSAVSLTGDGHIAAFNLATKLVELPTGIAITTIAVVAFPLLAAAMHQDDSASARSIYASGVQKAVLAAIALAVPAIWFAHPIVSLIFSHGAISDSDLALIAQFSQIGFLMLPAVAVSSMATAMLNAQRRAKALLRCTLLSLLSLPVGIIPAVATGDVMIAVATLPLFHFVLAILLAKTVGDPLWESKKGVMQRACLGLAVVLMFIGMDALLPGLPNEVRVGLALTAMAASLFALNTVRRPFISG